MKYLIFTTKPFSSNWLPSNLAEYLQSDDRITHVVDMEEMTFFDKNSLDWLPIEEANKSYSLGAPRVYIED